MGRRPVAGRQQGRRWCGRGLRAGMESAVEPEHTVARRQWLGQSRQRGVDRSCGRVDDSGRERCHKQGSRLGSGGGPVQG
jgi:hypothetical protein